jgi:hypothetical protein
MNPRKRTAHLEQVVERMSSRWPRAGDAVRKFYARKYGL